MRSARLYCTVRFYMSVRQQSDAVTSPFDTTSTDIGALVGNHELQEGNGYTTSTEANCLTRKIAVSIRASLNDLILKPEAGSWAPTTDALHKMLQQTRFVSLDGANEAQGDLKSIVLHSMACEEATSSFPISVGAHLTGVDNNTFSLRGDAFGMVMHPNSKVTTPRVLQSDPVAATYEFAKKFPGYTANNLSVKGVHEVTQRRFCLVAADHPIVTAITENADRLQIGAVEMMPEGLVKISSDLYNTVLPMVAAQVGSQIKVRDFSGARVSIKPSEHASWKDARQHLVMQAQKPLRAKQDVELAAAADAAESSQIEKAYCAKFADIEQQVDHTPRDIHCTINMKYNFLSNAAS